MAIARTGVSFGSIGESTSVSVSRPSGASTGDLLVVSLLVTWAAGVTPPDGWTKLVERYDAGGDFGQWVFYRIDSGAAGPFTFNLSFSAYRNYVCVAYSGTDSVDASASQLSSGNSLIGPSVTTTVNDCMLLMVSAVNGPGVATPPGGMTEIAEADAIWAGEEQLGAAGATGTRTALLGGSFASWTSMIALAPEGEDPEPPSGGTIKHRESGTFVDRPLKMRDSGSFVDTAGIGVL